MSATDVQNHWGEFVRSVTEEGQTVVVENRREPMLVAISPADFDEYQALRREKLLREVRESLIRIQETQRDLTQGLSEHEADALIEQVMEEDRAEDVRSMSTSKPSS